jgi:hypothetical protein
MGACNTKLSLTNDLSVELSSNPDPKTLLMLQLHYNMYDSTSQKKIDELCQLSLLKDHSLKFTVAE